MKVVPSMNTSSPPTNKSRYCMLHGKGGHSMEECNTLKEHAKRLKPDKGSGSSDTKFGNKTWSRKAHKATNANKKELAAFIKKSIAEGVRKGLHAVDKKRKQAESADDSPNDGFAFDKKPNFSNETNLAKPDDDLTDLFSDDLKGFNHDNEDLNIDDDETSSSSSGLLGQGVTPENSTEVDILTTNSEMTSSLTPLFDLFVYEDDDINVLNSDSRNDCHFNSLDEALDCYALGTYIRGQSNPHKRQRVDDVELGDRRPIAFIRFNSRIGKAKPITLRALLDSGGGGCLVAEKFTKKLKIRTKSAPEQIWTTPGGNMLTTARVKTQCRSSR